MIGTMLGPYEVVAKLGEGGMGEVYRARDTRLGREVAIKVLPAALADDPARLQRFEQEARAIAALNHPNILAIHDFGQTSGPRPQAPEGTAAVEPRRAAADASADAPHASSPTSQAPTIHYIVTELLDGETLRDRLAQGALPVRKAIEYAVQIARGLAAAHDKGLIHRDLKPENIFLLGDGQVKILDFGLATSGGGRRSDQATVTSLTDPGTVLGTVGYMAPEQVRGQTVDARTDLFALGAVLYEMLSGQRAFSRETAADTMTAVLKEDPPELTDARADLSPALDRIVRHCLEKTPIERFQTARDVAFALEALSGSRASSASTAVPVLSSRPRWVWPVVTAAGLVAAVALGMVVERRLTPAAPTLTFEKKTWDPMWITNARFGPDGQTIIFSAATVDNTPELFAIRPGTMAPEPVGDKATHLLSVSSKGDLAVLINARYDHHRIFTGTLARMTLDSPPRPWMDHVREADWAPNGDDLAIIRETPDGDQLEYPVGKVRYSVGGYLSDLRVSPDGSEVAFFEHQTPGDDRGWVKLLARDGRVKLLAGEYWGEEGLAWSPDGQAVWYSASNEGADDQAMSVNVSGAPVVRQRIPSVGALDVCDIASNGRVLIVHNDFRYSIRALLPGETTERELAWLDFSIGGQLSSDGRTLAFTDLNQSAGHNYAVAVRDVASGKVLRLGEGGSWGLSPDGRWVGAQIPATSELRVYPTGVGQTVRLDRGPIEQYNGLTEIGPQWFPDSRHVLECGREKNRAPRCYEQDINGGAPQPVTPEGVTFAWLAPDGRTLLAQTVPGAFEVLTIGSPSAGPARGLTSNDTVIGWNADLKSVVVSVGAAVPARIERVDLGSGARTLLREIAPPDRTGITSVRVSQWIDDGRGYVYDYNRVSDALFVVK